MGTIIARGTKWRAIVRRRGVTKTKTHSRMALAQKWVRQVEHELDLAHLDGQGDLLADVLRRYLKDVVRRKPYLNRRQRLYERFADEAKTTTIAEVNKAEWWIQFFTAMKVSPASRAVYLSAVVSALRTAEALWEVHVDWTEYRKAYLTMKKLGLLGTSNEEFIRISDAQFDAIKANNPYPNLPFSDIVDFALDSCMRSVEICSAAHAHFDDATEMLMIYNRKHPTKKMGNNWNIPMLGRCAEIIRRQPRDPFDDRIFPWSTSTIQTAFAVAAAAAGVEGVSIHKVRDEGISRLFEQGYGIPEVALVSGHRDWKSLKRYTKLRPEGLHNGPLSKRR